MSAVSGRRTSSHAARAKPGSSISPANLAYLCQAVYKDSGIVLDESKAYLIESRLGSLARREGSESIDSLCGLLRGTSANGLRERVVEAMTTNETLFFRDLKPFEALRNEIIPELTKDRRPGTLRIWSAACSSGQEAYSLTMLWKELRPPGWSLEIVGTDLSDEILARAQEGRYRQLEVNRGLPARYLVKYFEADGTDWVIKPELKVMTRWRQFNLNDSMDSLGPFDIVFCRNVLIYFDQETKASILGRIRKRLMPGGYLILGLSETTLNLDQRYERKTVGPAIVYQNPVGGA